MNYRLAHYPGFIRQFAMADFAEYERYAEAISFNTRGLHRTLKSFGPTLRLRAGDRDLDPRIRKGPTRTENISFRLTGGLPF